jgi:hypothetical protein
MRNIQTLNASLSKAKISAQIVQMDGQCIGVVANPNLRDAIKIISEYVGYITIQCHEYKHTHKEIDLGIDTKKLTILF